jgi:SAM-dependent methyltransferase
MGLYPYTVADLNNPGAAFPQRMHEWAEMTSEPQRWGEPLIDNLIADIAEWADEGLGDTARMVDVGHEMTASLFRSKPLLQTEAEWYRRDDVGMAYIGDLARWHMQGAIPPLAVLDAMAGKRLYDHGAGIGTYALIAAKRGVLVTVYEPNPIMREFITWRAEKYGLSIEVLDEAAPGYRLFDAVVCWHVFEHLEHPERVLDELLQLLARGGVFITDDGFDDHATPQHHEHPDWAGVLADRGLVSTTPCLYERAPEAVPA